jgi:SAM-dependent methyltransferase
MSSQDSKHIYSKISKDFSKSRWNVWPNVGKFIDSLDINSFNGDIGCGNGKNMLYNLDVKFIGMDICDELLNICKSKNLEVINGDILNIPLQDNYLDNVICIAVIHHFKNRSDRIRAIQELIRITKINGKILIYVWALEQPEKSIRKFKQQDNLVQFQCRQSGIYYRFYHVYKSGELEEEIIEACIGSNNKIINNYYDNGNWCVILQK